jgi:hexosaminidase
MKKLLLFAILPAVLAAGCSKTLPEADYKVVPLPQKIELSQEEGFELNKRTLICYPAGDERLTLTAGLLSEYIEFSTGLKLKVREGERRGNSIMLRSGLDDGNSEAYRMTVGSDGIVIDGASPAGTLFGVQTLRKSLPVVENGVKLGGVYLPAAVISDAPRFAYRGMHLDVCRHMFPLEFVKEYIDLLALHNMNTFHWHLTEDQGWRIEIKAYPRLTEIGSKRTGSRVGYHKDLPVVYDSIPVGGYFTQDEIREVVAYAADRNITVIPEIDLPGHMVAALASYPELGCTGGPYAVEKNWGVFPDVLCVGRESTFDFLEGVFTEVMELFPSRYIHIGGDECPKERWEVCPHCQARIKELGLKTDKEHTAEQKLQSYTISRVEKFLNEHGRSIIGWDETLEGGIAPNATIMSWRGTEGGITAAKAGHDAIMTPRLFCYFDYWQGTDKDKEPLSPWRHIPVEKAYSYEPFEEGLTQEEKEHIIGVQANLWTEYIKTPEHAEYMVLPRMDALSEVQWTEQGRKDYDDFLSRLQKMRAIYDKAGYNYAKHVFADK